MGVLLYGIARILFMIFLPFAILFTGIKRITSWKKINAYFYDIGYSIDQLGNVVYQDTFNILFIKSSSKYKFGEADFTVSYTLGENKAANTLTWFGKIIVWILNLIEKDHVIKALHINLDKTKRLNERVKSVFKILKK